MTFATNTATLKSKFPLCIARLHRKISGADVSHLPETTETGDGIEKTVPNAKLLFKNEEFRMRFFN